MVIIIKRFQDDLIVTLLALASIAFCLIQLSPLAPPCTSTGCALLKDFTLWGISLWQGGFVFFCGALVLLALGKRKLLFYYALLALLADACLLAVMVFSAACIACLGVASLIAMLFLAVWRKESLSKKEMIAAIAAISIWGGLFMGAGSLMTAELTDTWYIAGDKTFVRRVYFSPSCPSCRSAVKTFAGTAAFAPLTEKPEDFEVLLRMAAFVQKGHTASEALEQAIAEHNTGAAFAMPNLFQVAWYRFCLLRNKAEVGKLGFTQIPLIMINGMPSVRRE